MYICPRHYAGFIIHLLQKLVPRESFRSRSELSEEGEYSELNF